MTPLVYRRMDHNFAPPMKLEESIQFLESEMKEIGCSGTLSLDIDQPLVDRLRRKLGSRIGAALELEYMDQVFVIACDSWQLMEHNVYALHLALRQWRGMERWGIAPMVVLLEGFAVRTTAKPAEQAVATNSQPTWMQHLGLGPTATLDDAQAVYHRRAKKIASDTEALVKLNNTMEEVRAYFAAKS